MSYTNLKADKFYQNFKQDANGVILDVRSAREHEEGHIAGAINVVFTDKQGLINLDKSKSYYIHCRVGGRSAIAAFTLTQAGFQNVFNMNDSFEALQDLFEKAPIN